MKRCQPGLLLSGQRQICQNRGQVVCICWSHGWCPEPTTTGFPWIFFFFFPLLPADPYSHLGEYLFSNFLNRAHSSGSESQKNEMAVARRRKFGPWIPAMDGSLRYEATSLAKQVLDQHTHTHTHNTHTHTHHTHTHTHTHTPAPP